MAAVLFISYKLAKGAEDSQLMSVQEKIIKNFMSKQKGFISWKVLRDGGNWADLLEWETKEDAHNAMAASEQSPDNYELFALLDEKSIVINFFDVLKNY